MSVSGVEVGLSVRVPRLGDLRTVLSSRLQFFFSSKRAKIVLWPRCQYSNREYTQST